MNLSLEDDDNDESDFPLQFHEALGDHTMSDDVRKAIVWAAIQKFLVGTDKMDVIDEAAFTDKNKALSKSVMFHGPLDDFEKAVAESQRRQGVVVAPQHIWTEESQPVWIACLAN